MRRTKTIVGLVVLPASDGHAETRVKPESCGSLPNSLARVCARITSTSRSPVAAPAGRSIASSAAASATV